MSGFRDNSNPLRADEFLKRGTEDLGGEELPHVLSEFVFFNGLVVSVVEALGYVLDDGVET